MSGSIQYGKGSMPLIQMTDFGPDAYRVKKPPSADPKQQLLLEA
jgi:hypothetical protein